jgi:hypothetical protein
MLRSGRRVSTIVIDDFLPANSRDVLVKNIRSDGLLEEYSGDNVKGWYLGRAAIEMRTFLFAGTPAA